MAMLGHMRDRKGAGGLGCLLLLALLGAGIYAGISIGLPHLRHTSFEDRLTEITEFFRRQPEEAIRKKIIDTAAEFDIALTPKDVQIVISGDSMRIDIVYRKVVDLRVWQKTYVFETHRAGPY